MPTNIKGMSPIFVFLLPYYLLVLFILYSFIFFIFLLPFRSLPLNNSFTGLMTCWWPWGGWWRRTRISDKLIVFSLELYWSNYIHQNIRLFQNIFVMSCMSFVSWNLQKQNFEILENSKFNFRICKNCTARGHCVREDQVDTHSNTTPIPTHKVYFITLL